MPDVDERRTSLVPTLALRDQQELRLEMKYSAQPIFMALSRLSESWNTEAAKLRSRGLTDAATLIQSLRSDLEDCTERFSSALLSIAEASAESGYSEETLRRRIRQGRLPAERQGSRGHYRVQRGSLPLKPDGYQGALRRKKSYDVEEDARDIAERLRRQ